MMYALAPDSQRTFASPMLRGSDCVCPQCATPVVAHCGPLVSWHWAHKANDCDTWAEPETEWHLSWKRAAMVDRGASVEVIRTVDGYTHRADIIIPGGTVIELQHGYLAVEDIEKRERFWQAEHHLAWLYHGDRFVDRLHFGKRGFWWKHGARSMLAHRCPVYWHVGSELWQVSLGEVTTELGARRVLGRIIRRTSTAIRYPSLPLLGEGTR